MAWKTSIYREIAFGTDKWARCFGADVVKEEDRREELSSLPWKEFIEDRKKFKRVFSSIKKEKNYLMLVRLPKTLKGGLTLKSLGELAKKYFPRPSSCYKYIRMGILENLGDKSIDRSRWY